MAFRQIVIGFILLWLPGFIGQRFGRHLGLEGWVEGAWWSLGLSALSVAALLAYSVEARRLCLAIPAQLRTKTSRVVLGAIVVSFVIVAGSYFLLYKVGRLPAGAGTHFGWAHYFSLPVDRRPDFLLHYLWISAVETVVTGPWAEEVFHVGIVVAVLRKGGFPWWWIVAFDALLFTGLHYSYGVGRSGFAGALNYTAARVLLDLSFWRTGNIGVPLTVHMLHNLLVLSFNWFRLIG